MNERVHLVGVCGAGMSGIARVLGQRGAAVSGCDLRDGLVAAELRGLGVRVDVGHHPDHVRDADVLVLSSAVPSDSAEVVAAHAAGVAVRSRAAMLASLVGDDRSAFVAGTHGKTTTTSMLVVAAQAAGKDPTFLIGGALNESGANAHAGSDALVIAEADESDRSFLEYAPDVVVVTNVEFDHPEEFTDLDDVVRTFADLLARRRPGGRAVVCLDDAGVRAVLERTGRADVLTYGTGADADVRLFEGPTGTVRIDGRSVALELAVPGRHNALNATGALAAAWALDLDPEAAVEGLRRFRGAARRFQRVGRVRGIEVVDDYAHHPTELRATLAAARPLEHRRIVLVVQPHRYSRTTVLGQELGRAAAAADVVFVTDVYGAGEAPIPGTSGALVADAARASGGDVRYVPHLAEVLDALLAEVRDGDLVLTTGAGDVTSIGPALVARLGGA